MHATGQCHTGSNMNMIANLTVVFHHRPGVNNYVGPEMCVGPNDGTRRHCRAAANLSTRAYRGIGVDRGDGPQAGTDDLLEQLLTSHCWPDRSYSQECIRRNSDVFRNQIITAENGDAEQASAPKPLIGIEHSNYFIPPNSCQNVNDDFSVSTGS